MNRYRVRPRAEQDLVDHFAMIATDKIAPAERFLLAAEQTFDRLAAFPGMGRRWESDNRKLQGIQVCPMPSPYRSYLIFYLVDTGNIVEILTILHAARDIGSVLAEIIA
jgi:plasmid stabilization system protein ParE